MNKIKILYKKFAKVEELITSLMLVAITILVFLSAVARTIHHPLNWAIDLSLLLFAWEVFLGGDIAIRNTKLIGVEILANKFPPKGQKTLKIVFFYMIIVFCAVLTYYGIILSLDNVKRLFQVLAISYSWCTLSVSVGSFLMIISSFIRITEIRKSPLEEWETIKKERTI
jgi:TRAP-type C4-dicarboxylate transport system permease small subunit